jgi:hypothetical protein
VGASRGTNVEREALVSLLARAGAGELQWTGLDLAAVHVLVPRAIVMPGAGGGHGALYPELAAPDEAEVQGTDWWQGARGFWYPLTPD